MRGWIRVRQEGGITRTGIDLRRGVLHQFRISPRDTITFFIGQGLWIWLHAALGGAFLLLAAVLWYMVLDPKGPGGGAFLAFLGFFVGWAVLLILSTVNGILWARVSHLHWALWILLLIVVWAAVGFLWMFLFMASDPNYPQRLVPGRILFGALTLVVYLGNLAMLVRVRGGG